MDNEKENERDTKRETGNMNGEADEAARGVDFRNALGIRRLEAKDGHARCELPVRPSHYNVIDILHLSLIHISLRFPGREQAL